MRAILILSALLLLASCETPGGYGPDTPYYRYPEGSRFILNRELEIPAGRATVRMQAGRVVSFGHVREEEPHCILEIDTVSPQPQRVEPDTFSIVKVQRSMSEISGSAASFVYASNADGGRPAQMFYKTIFTLRSERQPGVRWMTCQSDQYAGGISIPRDLTVPEIRQALGDIFTLELP